MCRHLILRNWIGLFGLLMPLCMGWSVQAAPVCSQLLLREDFYLASLDDLARMKLELDLTMTEGPSGASVLSKVRKVDYSRKYAELVAQLSKHFSKEQVNNLLRTRISKLQDKDKKEEATAKKKQQEERRTLLRGQFKHVDRIELPFEFEVNHNEIEIVPGTDFVLIGNGLQENFLYNFKKKESISIRKGEGFAKLIPGAGKIVIVNDSTPTSFQIYDIQSGASKEILYIGTHPPFTGVVVPVSFAPSGRYMAYNKGQLLNILDLHSGEVLVFPGLKNAQIEFIKEFLFINDREVLVEGTSADYYSQAVAVLDTHTGIAKSLPETVGADNFSLMSQNQKVLMALNKNQNGEDKFALYDAQNIFAGPVSVARSMTLENIQARFMTVPQSEFAAFYLLKQGWDNKPAFEIYNLNNLEQLVFKFDIYDSDSSITAQNFAPNAESAVFLYKENYSTKRFLDVWSAQ